MEGTRMDTSEKIEAEQRRRKAEREMKKQLTTAIGQPGILGFLNRVFLPPVIRVDGFTLTPAAARRLRIRRAEKKRAHICVFRAGVRPMQFVAEATASRSNGGFR